jgi:hypothetical protein
VVQVRRRRAALRRPLRGYRLLVHHEDLPSIRLRRDGAGGLMGLCFACMWAVSLYQMWFSRRRPPSHKGRAAIFPPSTETATEARGDARADRNRTAPIQMFCKDSRIKEFA